MSELVRPPGGPAPLDWQELYELYAEDIVRFVTKLLGDRERAAELAHDVFIRAIGAESDVRDRRRVQGWLFAIAANTARNELRRRRLLRFLPFSGHERGAPEAFDPVADQIHRALRSIPADQAVALVLHYQQGFARREIAEMTGVTEEAVKSRLARGRANFRAAYARLERGLAG